MSPTVTGVPILRIPYSTDEVEWVQRGLAEVLASGFLSGGARTTDFEERFAAFTGANWAIACNSGTSSIELILRGLGIENRSVIVPTNTFMATPLAVMHAGNRVIFADSEPETLGLDVADVESRIQDDTAAVVTVHVGGVISPTTPALRALCERRGLALIEDCAHAHGSTLDGQQAGTIGVAGSFSFFATKVMTTGEGGMVTTDDDDLAGRVRMLRNHGKNPERGNRITELGSNYRMSEITALLGIQQMLAADANIRDRQRAAAHYDAALRGASGVTPLAIAPNATSSYYKYVAYLEEGLDRQRLKGIMKDELGVSLTGEVYATLCHGEPLWEAFTLCGKRRTSLPAGGCGHGDACAPERADDDFPGAEYASRHHICLPAYVGLEAAELDHVVDSLLETVRRLGGSR